MKVDLFVSTPEGEHTSILLIYFCFERHIVLD